MDSNIFSSSNLTSSNNGHKPPRRHKKCRRPRGQRQNAKLRLLQQQQLQMLEDIKFWSQQQVENEQELSYQRNQVLMIEGRQLDDHHQLQLLKNQIQLLHDLPSELNRTLDFILRGVGQVKEYLQQRMEQVEEEEEGKKEQNQEQDIWSRYM